MKFSLIIATVERVRELEALLNALTRQSCQDFEVIVVDQNADDRLAPIIESFKHSLAITWLRSDVRNNSHARNLGLRVAAGAIMAFPDDDCLYPPEVLSRVGAGFAANPALDFFTGPALSFSGGLGDGRWHKSSCAIDIRTVWTTVTEFNLFVKMASIKRCDGFDEHFGLGARFGSAEGIDMVLRMMKAGGRGHYDYDLRVLHPDKGFTEVPTRRAFRYGTGLGRVLRKHRIAPLIALTFFIRPAGGIVVNMLERKFLAVKYHWETLRGRINGYFARV